MSETLFRVLRVLKLFSRDFLFFRRYWKTTKKQTMQKEFNLINQSLKLQQQMMDFPVVPAALSYNWNIKLYSLTQVPLGLNIHTVCVYVCECVRCWR